MMYDGQLKTVSHSRQTDDSPSWSMCTHSECNVINFKFNITTPHITTLLLFQKPPTE